MIKNKLRYLILGLSFCFSSIYGWNHTGHSVVGQIAYDNLTPQARSKVDPLIRSLKTDYPETSTFVTSAVWMDDIKTHGLRIFDSWHYIDTPWCPSNQCKKTVVEHANAVTALLQSKTTLEKKESPAIEKAIFLRVLIHVTGDIHQPLHGISLFNKQFPRGDFGATIYKIKGPADTLHSYWDSGLGVFSLSPYEATHHPDKIQALAKQLEQEYPPAYFGTAIDELQPQRWAKESYKISQEFVYKTPEGKAPTKSYRTQGQEIAKQRATLAGYRLARILNELYAP